HAAPLLQWARKSVSSSVDDIRLALPGDHQRKNAAAALAVVECLQQRLPVSASAIREGLEKVNWPGRLQIVKTSRGQNVILDGAHNPDGAQVLRNAIPQVAPKGLDA